jgi:hypothetical protein
MISSFRFGFRRDLPKIEEEMKRLHGNPRWSGLRSPEKLMEKYTQGEVYKAELL